MNMSDSTDIFSNQELGRGLLRPRFSPKLLTSADRKEPLAIPQGDIALQNPENDSDCVECTTCGDRVSKEVLEFHREKCLLVCQLDFKPSDTLASVIENLRKFQVFTNENRKEFDLNTFITLNRNSHDLLANTPERYEITEKVINNLESFSTNFRGNHTAKMYVEKLLTLARDLKLLLKTAFLNEKREKIQRFVEKKPQKHVEHEETMHIDFVTIDKISSKIKTKYCCSENFSGTLDECLKPHSSRDNLSSSLEDMKPYFLSQCVKAKFQLLSHHPGQKVKATKLYFKALKLNLPLEMWQDFIVEELNNPDNWLSQENFVRRPSKKNRHFAANFI